MSDKVPQTYPPINIPPKVIELNKPLSPELIFKSHAADGRTNETQRISMASLAFANAQTMYSSA